MRTWWITAAIVYAVLASPFGESRVRAEEKKLVVIHINDIHGVLDPFAKVARFLQKEREVSPDVLFLSAGDNFTGNAVVDQYEPKGRPLLDLFNELRLDMMVLGNHDFDYGQEVLGAFMKQARFPFLCANLNVDQSGLPAPVPFVLRTMKNGLRVALLGLTQIDSETGNPDSLPERLKGLRFSNPLIRAAEFRSLRRQCDVFIALTHLGLEDDVRLAQSMPELDLIVGGHSHTMIRAPRETNGVLIVQAGGNLQFLGRVELVWKEGKIIRREGSLLDLALMQEEDPVIRERIAAFNRNPRLTRKVRTLSAPLEGKGALGSLMADAVREALSLDVVFQNNGGIRANSLSGDVQIKDLYALDPFGNDIVVFRMTPAEIRGLIQYSFDRRKEIDLQVSGMEYQVVPGEDGKAKKINMRRPGGESWEESKTYRVGLNSFLATAYRFPHEDPGVSGRMTCAEALLKFLEKNTDLEHYRGMVRTGVLAPRPEGGPVKDQQPGGDYRNSQSSRKVGFLNTPLEGKGALGSLMADAVRETLSLDVVFQNNGGIRTNSLFGEVRVKDLYALDPFGNDTLIFQMTPAEIRSLIRNSFDRRGEIDLQVSGTAYEVIIDGDGKVKEIRLRKPNGEEWQENKSYRVGLSSFVATRYRFDHRDSGASGAMTCAEALVRYLEKGADLERYRGMERARVRQAS